MRNWLCGNDNQEMHTHEFEIWAFGKTETLMTEVPELWNKMHPDLPKIYDNEPIDKGRLMMLKEWRNVSK